LPGNQGTVMDITTSIAGIKLKHPVFNAAGPICTTKEELDAIGASAASAIVCKTMTKEPRKGNPEPRYADFGRNSINSMGLPNPGYKAYMALLPQLARHEKPIIASFIGMTLEDSLEIVAGLNKVKEIAAIEMNLSCPNLPGKPQVAYDFQRSGEVLAEVGKIIRKPWGVKLPPYFDEVHFKLIADILNGSTIQFVSVINSPGNGLVIDRDKEQVAIRPKQGFGGIGGPAIKPFGLANARKMRQLLKPKTSVVGVGGITTGGDVFDYILAGADAVQVGTAFMQEGPGIFGRLAAELEEVMTAKGYSRIADFRNKLKEW